jgi:uncharacterized OB-fold protein
VCADCGSSSSSWQPVSGRGVVYAFVVIHHNTTPGFDARTPYVVAWIELPEQGGLRLLSDVVGADPGEVEIGSAVEVVFDAVNADLTVPRFRLAR